MMSLTQGSGEVRLALVTRYAAAHDRLMNGKAPPAKPTAPRPRSPFSPGRLRLESAVSQARLHRLFPQVIVEIDDYGNEIMPDIPKPAWKRIAEEVAAQYGVSLNDLVSARRDQAVVRVRFEAMYRIKNETPMSLPQIGRKFNRDHTSVLHAIRKHELRLKEAANA